MIDRKEYAMLKKIEDNNVSDEILKYSAQPKNIIRLHETEVLKKFESDNFKNETKDDQKKEYSEEFRKNLKVISRLIDRDLIIRIDDNFVNIRGPKNNNIITLKRIFRLTDKGYEMLLEHRRNYRFWFPIGISILAVLTGIASLVITFKNL